MKCPTCQAATKMIETREPRRRRECLNGHRFSSVEILLVKGQTVDEMIAEGQKKLDEQEFAERVAMAKAPGRAEDVANAYGVSPTTVYTWRARVAGMSQQEPTP